MSKIQFLLNTHSRARSPRRFSMLVLLIAFSGCQPLLLRYHPIEVTEQWAGVMKDPVAFPRLMSTRSTEGR